MSNKRINLAALDFDTIKANLKSYLRDQPQFSDYDFEGSNMSILLDVLAYNTHYNAMYMNLAVNEVFLDSASKRPSVVSLAQSLGYTPRSATCATGVVSFTLSNITGNPAFFTVAKGTAFYSIKDGIRYNFFVAQDVTAQNVLNSYNFTNVKVTEGQLLSSRFNYTSRNAFTINAQNVDTSTITVRVQDNASTIEYDVYTNAVSYSTIDGTSKVYFLRETATGLYQLSFGDGILGKALASGNIINVSYAASTGEDANGITSLTFANGSVGNGVVTNITLTQPINGGRLPEDIESIRFNAPNFYASQNRAVTAYDYEALILSKLPSIESVLVWGGDQNDPPIYGKVFICPKTVSGEPLTFQERQSIVNDVISDYKVVSVLPEVVDPDFIDVEVDLVMYYDPSESTKSPTEYASIATTLLNNYNDTELQKFSKVLRKSAIIQIIEDIDSGVMSVVPRLRLWFGMPIYSQPYNYSTTLSNPIMASSLLSNAFFINGIDTSCYIDDDGNGLLRLFTFESAARRDIRVIGTVDYTRGAINIENLLIVASDSPKLQFKASPQGADIVSINRRIVQIDPARIKVSVVADNTTKGRMANSSNYTFAQDKI